MSEHYFHVVCVTQEHYPELIFGKIYKAREDEQGKEENWIRVWSETEDLLFPQKWFKTIELSREVEAALDAVSAKFQSPGASDRPPLQISADPH